MESMYLSPLSGRGFFFGSIFVHDLNELKTNFILLGPIGGEQGALIFQQRIRMFLFLFLL